jgi:hypothetical protein
MKQRRKRKCRNCGQLYDCDRRNRRHQKYCSSAACKKASKEAAQAKWRNSVKGRDYFKGAEEVTRVQQWREQNPGYWRKQGDKASDALQDLCSAQLVDNKPVTPVLDKDALQDRWLMQHPLVVGLMAMLAGDTLQDDIDGLTRRVHARGQQILGMEPRIQPQGEDRNDHQTACCSRSATTDSCAVQLD